MLKWLRDNHQAVTAVGAMMVAVAALFVAWDQARVMRAQQHGSAYPVLQVDGYVATSPTSASLGITVANHGVGPALIEHVQLYRHGERQFDFEAYRSSIPEGYDLSWSSLTGRALAAGDSVTPLNMRWSREDISDADLQQAATDWDGWDVVLCYCSVFQRCWRTSLIGGARAERVQQCELGETDPFEQLGEAQSAAADSQPTTADTPEEQQ